MQVGEYLENDKAKYKVGEGFGLVVKTLVEMPTAQFRAPGCGFSPRSQFQFPDNAHPAKQQAMTQVVGSWPPLWGISIEFFVPGFSWSSLCDARDLGNDSEYGGSLCLSLDKHNLKKKI